MELDINTRFAKRIILMEDLLDAIQDQPTFATFHSEWMLFVDDLNLAIDADVLSLKTISKSHSLAHRVSDVVQAFLDLEILSKKLISSLTLEVSSILDDSSESSTSRPTSPSQKPPSPLTPPQDTGYRLPSYIKSSYEWLLAHLHNPYPSIDIRDGIVKATGYTRKDIDGWFIDVRKRIGWNALRKKYFSNSRADIIDAATRFFIEEDPKRPIEDSIKFEFLTVESRANDLYSEKLSASELALKLNMVVKDMTPEMKAQAKVEERHRRLREQRQYAISSYPSPDRSSPPSPLPFVDLYDGDLEVTTIQSINQSGKKRRSSSVELCDIGVGKPPKRARMNTPLDDEGANSTGPFSPPTSVHDTSVLPDDKAPSATRTKQDTRSRKRRLSDADSQGAPKRPRNLDINPRSQTVSDPAPFSVPFFDATEFDGWFHKHFDNIPNVGPDSSASLEVELYDVSKLNDQNIAMQYLSPHPRNHNGLSHTLELADMKSLDFGTSAAPHDKLFLSNDFQGLAMHDSGFLDDLSPTLGLDLFRNTFSFYDTPIQPIHSNDHTLIADTSSPVCDNPAVNMEWAFPSFISASRPTTASTEPSDEFHDLLNTLQQDLSMLTPPIEHPTKQSMSFAPLSQTSAQHDRVTKQQRLREIQEAARRLEAELAATTC